MCADRGVDCELIGRGHLVVQRPDNGNCAPGPVDGEEGGRRLEGEEDTASGPLVGIGGVHHEHGAAHWRVLQEKFRQNTQDWF